MTQATISKVLHPSGDVLALEIVANDGSVYFVGADPFWQGLRVGAFPNGSDGVRLARVEVARLGKEDAAA